MHQNPQADKLQCGTLTREIPLQTPKFITLLHPNKLTKPYRKREETKNRIISDSRELFVCWTHDIVFK